MTTRTKALGVTLVAATLTAAGFAIADAQTKPAHPNAPTIGQGMVRQKWRAIKQGICVIRPTEGNTTKGIVRFIATDDGVRVVADVQGLTPNAKHGFHIHRFGDCSAPDGTSAGGHYNPTNQKHGLPPLPNRHAGDLGNLAADENGHAHHEATLSNIVIAGPGSQIIGRGMIIHAKPDDGGQPTGNAGGRIGCGVIGVANHEN